MQKRRRDWMLILLMVWLLPLYGCSGHISGQTSGPVRVVTKIDVTYQNGPLQVRRHYNNASKLSMILNYLRVIDPYGTPQEDPETVGGSVFQIQLTYSDGTQKKYLQKSDRYMQVDGGSWKNIDPGKAAGLSELLGQMASDPEEI